MEHIDYYNQYEKKALEELAIMSENSELDVLKKIVSEFSKKVGYDYEILDNLSESELDRIKLDLEVILNVNKPILKKMIESANSLKEYGFILLPPPETTKLKLVSTQDLTKVSFSEMIDKTNSGGKISEDVIASMVLPQSLLNRYGKRLSLVLFAVIVHIIGISESNIYR